MSNDDVQAWVEDGPEGLVLRDPAAEGMIAAVEHHNRRVAEQNCRDLVRLNKDRIAHFRQRAVERLFDPKDVCIVLLDVDDPLGGQLAEALMPGQDWQAFRARGEKPIARGIAMRTGIDGILTELFPHLGKPFREAPELPLLVLASGTAILLDAEEASR